MDTYITVKMAELIWMTNEIMQEIKERKNYNRKKRNAAMETQKYWEEKYKSQKLKVQE